MAPSPHPKKTCSQRLKLENIVSVFAGHIWCFLQKCSVGLPVCWWDCTFGVACDSCYTETGQQEQQWPWTCCTMNREDSLSSEDSAQRSSTTLIGLLSGSKVHIACCSLWNQEKWFVRKTTFTQFWACRKQRKTFCLRAAPFCPPGLWRTFIRLKLLQ